MSEMMPEKKLTVNEVIAVIEVEHDAWKKAWKVDPRLGLSFDDWKWRRYVLACRRIKALEGELALEKGARRSVELDLIASQKRTGDALARVGALENTLREIAKGEGRFSLDHLTHASNTIEDMKSLAVAALLPKDAVP